MKGSVPYMVLVSPGKFRNTVVCPFLLLFSFCLCIYSLPAHCDSEGKFPGKGSYSRWRQAADANEDGVDYARRGKFAMAVKCYDEAIEIYPDDASFYFNKATALKKDGKTKDALPVFDRAIELEPGFISAWYNRGNAELELRSFRMAESSFRQALKLDAQHMHACFNLGEALYFQKKFEEARQYFQQAEKLPGSEKDKKDIADYLREIDIKLRKKSN